MTKFLIKICLFLSLYGLNTVLLPAQTDSLMQSILSTKNSKPYKIKTARFQLKTAFEQEDWGEVNAWLGFLETQLDDEENAATLSDERWLLYYWTGNYGQLFSEVGNYTNLVNEKIQYQEPPLKDSLFDLVDRESYKRRFELVKNMQADFLSEDEKAFGSLLLDFILRLDDNEAQRKEKNLKIKNFIAKYPKSRFNNYANTYMNDEVQTNLKRHGFFDLSGTYGRHTYLLGATFKPYYGFSMGFFHTWKRLDMGFRGHVGGQKIKRNFTDGNAYFVPDSSALVFDLGGELAFTIINNKSFKIAPFTGYGYNYLGVQAQNLDVEEFGKSNFSSYSWTAGLGIDFKNVLKLVEPMVSSKSPYTGLKVRVGYRGLNHKNTALQGNQIFVSIGMVFAGNY
jgi:hypothetical protein